MEFGKYFDHTILSPDATADDVDRICAEAKEYNFASVCVVLGFSLLNACLRVSQQRNEVRMK